MAHIREKKALMDKTSRKLQRLLIVDDSKVVRVTARKILGDHFETTEAIDGENAWDVLTSEAPFSLIITDLNMPNLDGFDLLDRIRKTHLHHISSLPVIIITGADDTEKIKERATQAGATDFIGKPFDSVHLLARAQAHASAHSNALALKEETLAMEDASSIDPLTKIANEMAFMERGYQQLAYAIRHNTKLSIFRIEVDNFGALYKMHGDKAAKNIVQIIASTLTTAIRHEDTAARIGAARFAMLLPGLTNKGIHNLADRIRRNIREHVLKHGDSRISCTVSIGVAAMEIRRDTRFDDLLSIANNRLVYAIAHGGDQVIYDGEDHTIPSIKPDEEMATVAEHKPTAGIEARQTPPEFPKTPLGDARTMIECRSTNEAVSFPASSATTDSIDFIKISPAPVQTTPAPLYVPDLSLPTKQKTDIPTAGTDTADEVMNNLPVPSEPGRTTDAPIRKASSMDSVPAENHSPAIQTVDIRTVRIGILERILTRIQSFFKKASPPK